MHKQKNVERDRAARSDHMILAQQRPNAGAECHVSAINMNAAARVPGPNRCSRPFSDARPSTVT
jgi:hypothetical protein